MAESADSNDVDDVPAVPRRTPSPLMTRRGAVAASGPDDGVAWHYGDPTAEQRALARGAAVVDLSHYGVITVTGPDRMNWLNSVLTQSTLNLAPQHSIEAMVLDPQGRIEHVMGIVDDGETSWLISETAPALAAWLDKMRFMMRVEVTDVTAQWAVLGEPIRAEGVDGEPVTWSDPWPNTAVGGTRYGPEDAEHPGQERPWRLVLVRREELVPQVRQRESAGWVLAGVWAAEALRVEAWRPRATKDTDSRAIPHELDWLRTAVHLEKGCYRGQESIARVHNLGRPPRRLVFLYLDGSEHLIPLIGDEVKLGEKTAGAVRSVAQHHELGPIALALVRRATDPEAELLVAAEGGPISAGQELIGNAEGVSTDRPAPRKPVARGVAPKRPAL